MGKDDLWSLVIKDSIKNKDIDISKFRIIGPLHSRLGTWSPIDASTRYYKSLMYAFAEYLNDRISRNIDNFHWFP